MSVQTEIDRIATAKNDIAAAIEAKSVTVPSGTTLDGMAALISQISAGTPIATGSVTSSNSTIKSETLTHNLGTAPTNCIMFLDSSIASAARNSLISFCIIDGAKSMTYYNNNWEIKHANSGVSVSHFDTYSVVQIDSYGFWGTYRFIVW